MVVYYCNCDSSRNYGCVRGYDDGDAGDSDDGDDIDGAERSAVFPFRHPYWNSLYHCW